MIIDVHTRIWTTIDQLGRDIAHRLRTRGAVAWETLDGSPAAHEEATACVDASLVLGFRSAMLDAEVPNELIAEFVARDPRRRYGIAGIDPMQPSAADDLEHAVALGMAGVTVSPALQGFHPAHSAAMRIYERCDELGLPLVVCNQIPMNAQAMLEFARPAAIDEVARTLPQLRVLITGLGFPWLDEALVVASKHDRVLCDVSLLSNHPWQLYNALLTARAIGVMEKLLFGSGFPFVMPAKAIETMYSLNTFGQGTQLPSIPRSSLRAIIERNAFECLRIDSEFGDDREEIRQDDAEAEQESAAASALEQAG